MSALHQPRNDRLDLRLAADQKRLIERAAECSGVAVSSFILGAAIPKANQVLRERELTLLSGRDWDRFGALLDDAEAAPSAALVRAARRYEAEVGGAR